MATNEPIRKWSQLQHMQVRIPAAGKTIGTVEDFYFKPESTAVDALLIRQRLGETLTLPISKIERYEGDAVIIDSEQMLTRRASPYPLASKVLGNKVQDEKGNEIGTIGEILLNLDPPIATRIAGFELGDGKGRGKAFTSDAVMHYENNQFTLQDQVARKLK